jgi:voltage-gated potassium channel
MLALSVIVFSIALWAMWLRPTVRYLALVLAVLSLSAIAIDALAPDQPALRALLMFSSAFFALTIYRVLRRVINISTVTQESLFGAGSVYLLIGLAFSTIYYVVWKAVPTAFHFDPTRTTAMHGWPDFVYFSFTTLATVGFGDIVPVMPIVRSLVVLEIITGVFFVAVIISKLVSLYRLR